jgi:hypothetical protein
MRDNVRSSSLEALEHETERTRADLTDTLAELRERMTPEHVKAELMGRARETRSQLMRDVGSNLRQAVIDNPVPTLAIGTGVAWSLWRMARSLPAPVLLIGAGLAGLAASRSGAGEDDQRAYPRDYVPGGVAGYGYPSEEEGSRSGRRERVEAAVSSMGERAREASGKLRETADEVKAHMSDAAGRVADAARDARSSVGEKAREVSGKLRGAADEVKAQVQDAAEHASSLASTAMERTSSMIGDAAGRVSDATREARSAASSAYQTAMHTASDAGDRALELSARARRQAFGMAERHPLLLGGVGVALGAVIGAAIRSTETENRLLGETSDSLKRRARDMAADQYERAQAVTERAYEGARREAGAQGLTPGAAGEAARSLGDKVSAVAESALEGARDEAKKQGLGQTGERL